MLSQPLTEETLSGLLKLSEDLLALEAKPVSMAVVGEGLPSANPTDLYRRWHKRTFIRRFERLPEADRRKFESELRELREELAHLRTATEKLETVHTIALLSVVAGAVAEICGIHGVPIEALVATTILMADYANTVEGA